MSFTQPERERFEQKLTEMERSLPPGVTVDQTQIATYCGVSRQTISQIERAAIKKLRSNTRLKTIWQELNA